MKIGIISAMDSEHRQLADRLSQKRESAAPSDRRTDSALESANTMGRLCSECAQMGVKMKAAMSGVKMEPPADSE